MDKWLQLHPKFKTALGVLVTANSALAIAVIQGTGSVRDLVVGVSISVLGLVGVYFGASNTKV